MQNLLRYSPSLWDSSFLGNFFFFFALLSKLLKLRVSTEFFLEKTRAEKGTSSQSLAKPLIGNRDTLSLSPLANLLSTESRFIEILHSTY